MKSFATLCLLAIATAVQLQDGRKERDGGCKRPRPCNEDIDEQGLKELGEGIVEKTRELAKDMGEDDDRANKRADEAAEDLDRWVREGKSCDQIRDNIEEQAKKDGVPEDVRDRALNELDEAAERVKERAGERKEKAALAQKNGGNDGADGADGENTMSEVEGEIREALSKVKNADISKEDVVKVCRKVNGEGSDSEGTGPSGPSEGEGSGPSGPSEGEDNEGTAGEGEPSGPKALAQEADKAEEAKKEIREKLGDKVADEVEEKVKGACRKVAKKAMKKKAKKEAGDRKDERGDGEGEGKQGGRGEKGDGEGKQGGK